MTDDAREREKSHVGIAHGSGAAQPEPALGGPTSTGPLARARPDPANVLLNPATSPTHELTDTAPAQPNELPPDPDGRHSHDHAEVDHPFGTHSTESSGQVDNREHPRAEQQRIIPVHHRPHDRHRADDGRPRRRVEQDNRTGSDTKRALYAFHRSQDGRRIVQNNELDGSPGRLHGIRRQRLSFRYPERHDQ